MKFGFILTSSTSLLAIVSIAACGGSKKGASGSSPVTPAVVTPAVVTPEIDSDLQLAGSLNILSSSSASLAADDAYDVYCVTFDDTPKACKAVIDATGAFDKTCEDYAGSSFGCFLRKNNKTVGDIQFDQGEDDSESQIVAGAGKLQFSINFDSELGVATGVVDKTASSALATDKIAAIQAAKGASGATTSLPNLTGNYSLTLVGVVDDDGNVQPPPERMKLGGGAPETIHLHDFEAGGSRNVAIWESASQRTLCLGAADDESKPEFGATVGSHPRVAINTTNLKGYRDSMGKIVGHFAEDHGDAFAKLVGATGGQWESQRCEDQERNAQNAAETFSAENCKIVSPANRLVKYFDPSTNQEVERFEPTWFERWADVQAADAVADANIAARTQACFNPLVTKPAEGDRFMPPCPPEWNEANSTQATGEFVTYDYVNGNERKPLQFVCKDPQGDGIMFLPTKAPTGSEGYLTASIENVKTQFSGGKSADPSCEKETIQAMFGTPYGITIAGDLGATKIYKANRRIIMQTFNDLLRESSHGEGEGEGNNRCSAYQVPSDAVLATWTFAVCDNRNGPTPPICWNHPQMLGALGLEVSPNKDSFVEPQGGGSFDQGPWIPEGLDKLCPTAAASFTDNQPNSRSQEDFEAAKTAEKAACKTEFVALPTFAAKVKKLFAATLNPNFIPPSAVLQCSDDTSVTAALSSLAGNSCLPEAQLDFRCDGGKCTEDLRCWGTEDGACVDADGVYQGRIPSRFELTKLKLGTNNTFNMSALTTETWRQWSEDGETICKAARGFKIQALKKSDSPFAFNGQLSSTSAQKCDNEEEETESEGDGGPNKMVLDFVKL